MAHDDWTWTITPAGIWTCSDDQFEGEVIGAYTTRDSVKGLVLQQLGTKVIVAYPLSKLRRST